MAKPTAITVVSSVPAISGRIPKCLSEKSGVHCVSVRNARGETSLKNHPASTARTRTIPAVVATETPAHTNSSARIAPSSARRAKARVRTTPPPAPLSGLGPRRRRGRRLLAFLLEELLDRDAHLRALPA